jgi:glycosyltransferase involved in cell wall biosynthesis
MPEQRRAIRADLAADDAIPLLGMVARFDPYKDHKNLFAALGHLRRRSVRFRCVLIGAGMDETNEAVRSLIEREEIADSVILLGARDDIPSLMNALDINVLSSLGEAFPNVLAEAMACGTPCVTTDVGDARIIVGDTGWFAPPGDPTALANALVAAIGAMANQELWQQRAADCRRRVEARFDVRQMRTAYRAVWSDSAPPVTDVAA